MPDGGMLEIRTATFGRAGFGLMSVALIVRRFGGWVDVESDRTGTSIHLHFRHLSHPNAEVLIQLRRFT